METIESLVRSSSYIRSEQAPSRRNGWKAVSKYSHSIGTALIKGFGTIYYNNKVVIYNEETGILEIRMGIGTKTETAYTGMHSVRMALYGIKGKVYNSLQELYLEKTGQVADASDMNKMKGAIRGETSVGDRRIQKQKEEERKAKSLPGRYSEKPEEVNQFSVRYNGDDGNAVLDGYVIPVASIDPNNGAYTYGDSGKVFYMEEGININTICRVSCSCSDYFFRIAWYNYDAGAHLGQQPASYPGKTSYSTTVQNVDKTPDLCKHLMMFVMLLLNGGIIKKEGTVNFDANLQLIRNRAEKLSVSRKLADNSDWGNHLRNLNQRLFQADRMRRSQISKPPEMPEPSPDGYYDWAQYNIAKRKGNHKGNIRKGLTRDAYNSQGAVDSFANIMKTLGVNDIESAKALGAYGRGSMLDSDRLEQGYYIGKGYKKYDTSRWGRNPNWKDL